MKERPGPGTLGPGQFSGFYVDVAAEEARLGLNNKDLNFLLRNLIL